MAKYNAPLITVKVIACAMLLYYITARQSTLTSILSNIKTVYQRLWLDKTGNHHVPKAESNSFDFFNRMHTDIMKKARSLIPAEKLGPTCRTKKDIGNLRTPLTHAWNLSENDEVRLSQMLEPQKMQLQDGAKAALEYMRKQVTGHFETILVTGASENHFLESQAFLQALHRNVFPVLKNFTLIYYNLDLTGRQRAQLVKYCRCTVIDFPFELFPPHFNQLTCYTWKPFIISAHLNQADALVWMDASVRFDNIKSHQFHNLLNRTKEKGMQVAVPSVKTPFHTQNSLYQWFGEEPCAYLGMDQFHATILFVAPDPFIKRVIIDPWTVCAWDVTCMCPVHYNFDTNFKNFRLNLKMDRLWLQGKRPPMYNLRHLYDQSAISIIIQKVFFKYYKWLTYHLWDFNIQFRRGDRVQYFPRLM